MKRWMSFCLPFVLTCVLVAEEPPKSDPIKDTTFDQIQDEIDRHPDVLAAEAEVKLAEIRLTQMKRMVGEEILSRRLELDTLQSQLSLAHKRQRNAEESFEITKSARNTAKVTMVDVLKAQEAVIMAESESRTIGNQIAKLKARQRLDERFSRKDELAALMTKVYPIGDIVASPEKIVELLKPADDYEFARFTTFDYKPENKSLVITALKDFHQRVETKLELLRRAGNAFAPK